MPTGENLWTVRLKVTDIQVTSNDEDGAFKYVREDFNEFRADWIYDVLSVDAGASKDLVDPDEDLVGDFKEFDPDYLLQNRDKTIFTFDIEFDAIVRAADAATASAAAVSGAMTVA